jgi:hypothetical protein
MTSLNEKLSSQFPDENEICKIYSLITLGFLCFIYDYYTYNYKYKNCKNNFFTIFILLIHHLYVSFLYFGWIFKDKNILILYIFIIFITIISQSVNENKCPSTLYVNINCNMPKMKQFRDILHFSNVKTKKTYNLIILTCFLIAFYKLSKI